MVIFLRGGMDALHAVCPYDDPHYRELRGPLELAAPGKPDGVLNLDGFFGLNPYLGYLLPLFKGGSLAIVHACGNPGVTLSHFVDSRAMERGVASADRVHDGWLARHLNQSPQNAGPLRALAISEMLPDSLDGALGVSAVPSLSEYRLPVLSGSGSAFVSGLEVLFGRNEDPISNAGKETLRLAQLFKRLAAENIVPENGAKYYYRLGTRYYGGLLARGLLQAARLIKADVGLEVVEVDLVGWDTHADQTAAMPRLLSELGAALSGFARDLGDRMQNVTVVAMTEFGRRLRPNSRAGTDHGKASAMFLLGGGVRGGNVYGRWPGLSAGADSQGNLEVTTDYRSVLAELLQRRAGNTQVNHVFPGFVPTPLNLFDPR